jgi:glycosyltransferase involved in cell wall biosynthesis
MFRVSVVIPVKNAEDFIERSLNSVMAQSIPVYEVVIVDNCSTDKTLEVLTNFEKKFSNVKVISNAISGVSRTRNVGIKHSSGNVIALLDADDYWDKEKVKNHLEHIAAHPDCALSFSGSREIQLENNQLLRSSGANDSFSFRDLLLNKFVVHGSASSVFISSRILDDIGYFKENLDFGEDWDLWLRIGRKFDLCELTEKLVTIQKHSGGTQGKRYRDITDFHRTFSLLFQWSLYSEELNQVDLNQFFIPTAASDLVRNWKNMMIWNGDWGREILLKCSNLSLKELGIGTTNPKFLPIHIVFKWIQSSGKRRFLR